MKIIYKIGGTFGPPYITRLFSIEGKTSSIWIPFLRGSNASSIRQREFRDTAAAWFRRPTSPRRGGLPRKVLGETAVTDSRKCFDLISPASGEVFGACSDKPRLTNIHNY
ncbi:hypothetical protein K0M31_006266 [Melipona bicolor]|uniref:Uncharacterized protein n=1 Tax=Melipona bicolor TaxID=60889 RepID=A0AA40FT70_9HYME|nr:hypothetical protein K0M31_006266 [Melipona bicolor]